MTSIYYKRRKRQQLFNTKEKLFLLSFTHTGLSEENILSVCSKLSPSTLKVLNFILQSRIKMGPELFFKKEYIAKQLGVCTRTVQRALRQFDELNFIERMHRVNETSLIRIAIEFYRPSLVQKLTKYLPILMVFLLVSRKANAAMVQSLQEPVSQTVVTDSFLTNRNQTKPSDQTVTGGGDGIKSNKSTKKNKWYQFTTRKGRRVNISNPKYTAINNIQSLEGLDKHDKHGLLVFPTEVIEQADKELYAMLKRGKLSGIEKPLAYFTRVSTRIMYEKGLQKEFKEFNELRKVIEHIPKTDHVVSFAEVAVESSPSTGKTKPVVSDFVAQQTREKTHTHTQRKIDHDRAIEKDLEDPRAAIEYILKHANPRGLKIMGPYFPEHLEPFLLDSEREMLGLTVQKQPESQEPMFNVPQVPKRDNNTTESNVVPFIGDDSEWEEM